MTFLCKIVFPLSLRIKGNKKHFTLCNCHKSRRFLYLKYAISEPQRETERERETHPKVKKPSKCNLRYLPRRGATNSSPPGQVQSQSPAQPNFAIRYSLFHFWLLFLAALQAKMRVGCSGQTVHYVEFTVSLKMCSQIVH